MFLQSGVEICMERVALLLNPYSFSGLLWTQDLVYWRSADLESTVDSISIRQESSTTSVTSVIPKSPASNQI